MNHRSQVRLRSPAARPWPHEPDNGPGINRLLDYMADTSNLFGGVEVPPYLVSGVCGTAAGFVLVAGLGLWLGVPLSILTAASVVALTTFLVVGIIRKLIAGRESHDLLEGTIYVLLVLALVARLVSQPAWTILDVFVPGIGAFLVFGRIGCLLSGCCHGRPCSFGIRYGDGSSHDELTGIRLFPVQLVEAIWLSAITSGALIFVLSPAPRGSALWFWVIGYAAGRFIIEFARGDVRKRFGPLTKAQWLCLAILAARVVYETWGGAAAFNFPQFAIIGSAAGLVCLGYATRSWWLALPPPPLLVPMIPAWQRFLDDLERDAASRPLLKELRRAAPSGSVVVGLLIDAAGEGRQTHSYSLRGEQGILEEPAAFALGGLIAQRLPAHRILRAGFCDAGVFHYWALVDPSGRAGSTVEDEPSLLRLRAQAFAELLRTVARMGAEPAPNPDPQLPAALDLKTEPASKYPAWYFRQNG